MGRAETSWDATTLFLLIHASFPGSALCPLWRSSFPVRLHGVPDLVSAFLLIHASYPGSALCPLCRSSFPVRLHGVPDPVSAFLLIQGPAAPDPTAWCGDALRIFLKNCRTIRAIDHNEKEKSKKSLSWDWNVPHERINSGTHDRPRNRMSLSPAVLSPF